ncbi:MAG: fused MFS/spermidine synthase [Candidatus Poseidoniia archaeon]|nr:fused MFS/spermidine synthase [Candidatus Poseidoniia archaeon]
MHFPKSIWSIRFNVFAAGAAVMALEIMGSRLLAPVFGNSVFVWGSLIGIVMSSLSAGYFLGGKLADRLPSFRTFSIIILAAGFFTILIPISSPLVLELVFYSGLGEQYGPLLATTLLLSAPTILLGMISPYAIRLATKNIVKVGGISGSLYSISTGGSILGTFFTVFLLIPSFSVRSIIFSIGVVLISISLIGLANIERVVTIIIAGSLMMPSTIFLAGTLSVYSGDLVYQTDTPYNSLNVVDNHARGVRTLWLNSMPHSATYLNDSNKSVFLYTDYFHLAFVFNPKIENVLFIGGGGFSGPKKFLEDYPKISVDVVEIDSQVVDIAKNYFDLKDDPRLNVYVEDGRVFLSRTDSKYDLIVLDAYSKTYAPFHLLTLEFMESIEEHLKPNGVLVSNLISSLIGDTSDLLRAEYKTANKVLSHIYLFHTRTSSMSQVQNIILIGSLNQTQYSKADLIEMAKYTPKRSEKLAEYASTYFDNEVRTKELPILTDDYAPAQSLLNPITGATYEGGDTIFPRSTISPILIAGVWILTLTSLYFMSTKIRTGVKHVKV